MATSLITLQTKTALSATSSNNVVSLSAEDKEKLRGRTVVRAIIFADVTFTGTGAWTCILELLSGSNVFTVAATVASAINADEIVQLEPAAGFQIAGNVGGPCLLPVQGILDGLQIDYNEISGTGTIDTITVYAILLDEY